MNRCEYCGCLIVPVDSQRYYKMAECIRHINTPDRCPGTNKVMVFLNGKIVGERQNNLQPV